MALTDGFFALGRNINKVKPGERDETQEGVISDILPELKVNIKDNKLIKLAKKWEKNWSGYYSRGLKAIQEQNEKYWLGEQHNSGQGTTIGGPDHPRPVIDNLLFQSLETFLPMATRQNPEPMVDSDGTPEGNDLSKSVKKMLVYQADRLALKLKGKKAVRYWALYRFGVMKISWSEIEDDIALTALRPQKLILDPDATIEEGEGYTGGYIGFRREDKASTLISRFPNKKSFFEGLINEKMGLGTKIGYIEWWTNDMVFWTLNKEVLDKAKNPNWNYSGREMRVDVLV